MTSYIIRDKTGQVVAVHLFDGKPVKDLMPSDFGYDADAGLTCMAVAVSAPPSEPECLKVESILQHSDLFNAVKLREHLEREVKEGNEDMVVSGHLQARVLCVIAGAKMEAPSTEYKIESLSYRGEPLGDWVVTVKQKKAAKV